MTGTLRSLPGMGGVADVLGQAGELAGDFVVDGVSIGLEFAIYEKDINAAFNGVLDIVMIVVKPTKCIADNSVEVTSNKDMDQRYVHEVAKEEANKKKRTRARPGS